MTQEDLAKELKVSQVLVSQYEKGTRKMPLETLEALSDIFECTMDDLMGTAFGKDLIENSYESKLYELLQTTDFTEDDYKQILHYVEFYISQSISFNQPRKKPLLDTMKESEEIKKELNKKRANSSIEVKEIEELAFD